MPQPTIPTLPAYPQQADPANFATEAETWSAALPDWTVQTNSMGTYITTQASTATAAAESATSSETVALAASNFKGTWASLTGALNKPSSVYHAGYYWLLLNNLANVTTSQPGVTADWQNLSTFSYFTPQNWAAWGV